MKLMNAFFVSTVLAGEFQRFDRWTCNKLCSLDMNHCFCIAKSGSRIFKMKFELRAMLHRRIFSPIQNQCHSSCSQCRCQRLAAQLKSHIRQDFAIEVTGSVSKWWLWALAFVATRIMLVSKVGQLEILGLLNGRSCNGMEAKSSGERCSYRVIPSFSQIHNSRNPHRLSEFLYRAGILFWSLLAHLAYMGPRWRQKDFHISHCFLGSKLLNLWTMHLMLMAPQVVQNELGPERGRWGIVLSGWGRGNSTLQVCFVCDCLLLETITIVVSSVFSMIGFERTIGSAATKPEIKASYSCDISLRSQKVHRKFSSTVIKRAEPNMVHKKHLLHGRNHWNHCLFPE